MRGSAEGGQPHGRRAAARGSSGWLERIERWVEPGRSSLVPLGRQVTMWRWGRGPTSVLLQARATQRAGGRFTKLMLPPPTLTRSLSDTAVCFATLGLMQVTRPPPILTRPGSETEVCFGLMQVMTPPPILTRPASATLGLMKLMLPPPTLTRPVSETAGCGFAAVGLTQVMMPPPIF